MPITKEQKQEIIAKYGSHAKDSGKTEVQIAILTTDIDQLTEHLKANPKDNKSKRGLQQKVGKRKRLLKYLKESDITRYREALEKFDLRK
jgi:small subunit ribosomal protein S15